MIGMCVREMAFHYSIKLDFLEENNEEFLMKVVFLHTFQKYMIN